MDKKVRWAVVYLLLLTGGATGLKNLKIDVPVIAKVGDTVSLSCVYDLDGPLYTIKWYLDDEEFYRYVPKAMPPKNSYSVHGIKVEISESNRNDVMLVNVSRELTGRYKCEVSEDQPTYHTATKEKQMEIADVPKSDPVIVVEKQRIQADEILKANCTSGASDPATNVTWTINGDPLNNTTMQFRVHTGNFSREKMSISWSALEVKASGGLFKTGRLRLRCFATIAGVYSASSELDIIEDAPRISPITGNASPHRGKSGCESTTSLPGTLEARWMRTLTLAATMLLSMLSR